MLDVQKLTKPSKYAIAIAMKLWGEEELINGTIEPGNSKHNKTVLGGEKLSTLKSKFIIRINCF